MYICGAKRRRIHASSLEVNQNSRSSTSKTSYCVEQGIWSPEYIYDLSLVILAPSSLCGMALEGVLFMTSQYQ